MAVKIDRETLAITALVGAMMIYLFSKKETTQQESADEEARAEIGELVSHLTELEGRYDGLHEELERTTSDTPLPGWVKDELNAIAKSLHQLADNAEYVDVDPNWWERHEQLRASVGDYLRRHGEEIDLRARFKAHNDRQGTAPQHVTLVQNNMHAHHNVDRRTVHAVKMEDNRTFQATTHKHVHMSMSALPTRDDEFTSAGPSGNAAIRDQQASNTITSTNAIENNRPLIVAKWGDVQLLPGGAREEPLMITQSPDEFISRAQHREPMSVDFKSAPVQKDDNHDKPPGEVVNQVVTYRAIGQNTTENFNEELEGQTVHVPQLSEGQQLHRDFQTNLSVMDGLIDAHRDSDPRNEGYARQRSKIKALISRYDQNYYSGLFSSEYGQRRDIWAGRLKKIDKQSGGDRALKVRWAQCRRAAPQTRTIPVGNKKSSERG